MILNMGFGTGLLPVRLAADGPSPGLAVIAARFRRQFTRPAALIRRALARLRGLRLRRPVWPVRLPQPRRARLPRRPQRVIPLTLPRPGPAAEPVKIGAP